MTNRYGPEATCQRTACATAPPHKAGRHLDQRDELYDGPDSLLQVLPLAVRDSARLLVKAHPEHLAEVVDLAKHIEFLRDQIAHIRVDMDHKVRDAMARSESCEHHGEEIKGLSAQLHAADERAERNDRGRVALLALLHAVEDFLELHRRDQLIKTLTVAKVIEWLTKATKRTSAAHARAWK
jgi:hypothetical protein